MDAYGITFVDDDAMTHHDFAFVDMPDGGWIFYRESALSPISLEDSWAAYRALLADGEPDPGSRADLREVEAQVPEPRHLRVI